MQDLEIETLEKEHNPRRPNKDMNPQGPDQENQKPNSETEDPEIKSSNQENDPELADEMEQFDALLDQHLPQEGGSPAPKGELIEVPVVAIKEEFVLVDVGGKAEATIRIEEFPRVDEKPLVKVGDIIKVVKTGRNSDGAPRVSYREARSREAEVSIKKSLDEKTPIKGLVVNNVKGGLMVDVGLLAFMPASQIDLFKIPDLSTMKGQEVEAYVIEFDERRKRAILSRRQLLFERREADKKEAIANIKEGELVKGTVKNTKEFGVFLNLGSIDGFIPREEVSYDRGTHPNEILKEGDEIETIVIKVDAEEGKITLSRKRLAPDPWEKAPEKFQVGSRVKGEVLAIQSYGIFVHLEEGITGMIHASDLSWTSTKANPKDYAKVGEEIEAIVLDIVLDEKRMSLGLKQKDKDPWADIDTKYPKNTKVKGTITSMTSYGAFVKIEEFIEGMIHVSDISWEKHINHPKEAFSEGDEVEAIVLKCDPDNRRLSLGVKQLGDSPFEAYLAENPVNSVVMGKVVRFAPFGAFVELAPNVEGLIHISQIDVKRVELPEKALTMGEEVKVKITKVEKRKQKISLSRREAIKDAENKNVKAYLKKENEQSGGMTFGEAFDQIKDQIDKKD